MHNSFSLLFFGKGTIVQELFRCSLKVNHWGHFDLSVSRISLKLTELSGKKKDIKSGNLLSSSFYENEAYPKVEKKNAKTEMHIIIFVKQNGYSFEISDQTGKILSRAMYKLGVYCLSLTHPAWQFYIYRFIFRHLKSSHTQILKRITKTNF